MVGAGFFMTGFFTRPFLPEDITAAKDRDEVCGMGNSTLINTNSTLATAAATEASPEEDPEQLYGLDKIAWPFIISGVWCIVFSFGYFILGMY